jgi:hypothetical protein
VSELRVSVWKRYGHDRLYVNLPNGQKVAWFDCRSGKLHLLAEEHRDAVLDALAPHLPSTSSPRASHALTAATAASVSLRAEDDLAGNRPGEVLRERVEEVSPGFWGWLVARLFGQRLEADGWRTGLAGERKAGEQLERLTFRGWRVLHSIPLPRDVDIDHLLIGPGGVFCVNTKCHPMARVWVGDDSAKIGGQSYPYVRKSRAEAKRATRALTRACGFSVDVQPVLFFVETAKVTVVPSLHDVRVVTDREVRSLGRLKGTLASAEVDAIYAAARNARTWAGA